MRQALWLASFIDEGKSTAIGEKLWRTPMGLMPGQVC